MSSEGAHLLYKRKEKLMSLGFTVPICNKFWEELRAYFLFYDKDHIENDASKNSSVGACVFYRAVA
jgi:hypothetical protein